MDYYKQRVTNLIIICVGLEINIQFDGIYYTCLVWGVDNNNVYNGVKGKPEPTLK